MTRPALALAVAFDSGTSTYSDADLNNRGDITVSRGNTQIVSTGFVADPGTASTDLDNIDRSLDPNYSLGPHGGGADLKPGVVPANLKCGWGDPDDLTFYDLITGTVDGWPQDFPLNGADQVVHAKITDGTAVFQNGSLYFQRGTDHTGARIAAVATALGWAGTTDISPGNAVVSPLRLGSVSAWSHITDVAQAEWGELYFDKQNALVFRSRDAILSDARSTVSQASYVQSGGFNYSGVTLGSPQLVNDCTISFNDSGDEVNAQDATSIATYGVRSLSISLPLHTKAQAQQYAQWIVDRYKDPITTFASVTFTPSNEPGADFDLWAEVLTRELGDLVTVTLDPLIWDDEAKEAVLSGEPIERDCWLRGIAHNITDTEWSVTFYLQDASWRTGLMRWDVSDWDGGDVWAL